MAECGFDNPVYDPNDPSVDDRHGDNDGDDQDPNETTHFWQGSASTPGGPSGEEIPMQTMQHEKSGLPDTSYDEIPSLEGFTHQDDKPALLERAKTFIKNKFPKVDFGKLGPIGFSKKSGNETKIVSIGPKRGESKIFRDDGGLLKSFTDKFKKSLGPEAESLIAQDNEEIRETRQSFREAESQLKEAEKLSSEREKALQEVKGLRARLDQTQATIDALHDEQGSTVESESELRRLQRLRKNLKTDFDKAKKEVAALQKQAKNTAKERATVDKLRKGISEKERERNPRGP